MRTIGRHLLRLAAATSWALLPLAAPAGEIAHITQAGQRALLENPHAARIGAKEATVTIVEYFDYNCPYCKKFVPTLRFALAHDRKLAVIYKDWPILRGISVFAAKAALAAEWQGKYLVAHDALLGAPRLTSESQVGQVLTQAGVDWPTITSDLAVHVDDINRRLTRNEEEARALGLRGTPGIVVGRALVPGAVDRNTLEQLIAQARHDH